MSIFKKVTQATAFTLLQNESSFNDLNINVSAINITNTGATETVIDLHVQPPSGGGTSHSIVTTTIPSRATLIYDIPFAFPSDHVLKITPSNTNALHITIN